MEQFLIVLVGCLGLIWLGVVFVGPPYVPTLNKDLETLFSHLHLGRYDHVVDLGAGDGRVLKKTVTQGARATGVEINPILSWIARFRLRGTRAKIVTRNMWHYTFPHDTTYVFVFCASAFIPRLERYLEKQARRGQTFRVISYGFTLVGREPEKVIGSFNIYAF